MAIKGKSKKKGGGGRRTAVAPKPVIVERKPPLLARRGVKRSLLIGVIVLAVLGGLRVWQNIGRSNDLKAYDRKLTRAQGLLTTHLDPAAITSLTKNASDFAGGKLTGEQFQDVSKAWERDFSAAKAEVAKLAGPKQLGDAQDLIVKGIDGYIGVARLYQAAAQQKLIAEAAQAEANKAKDPAFKKILEARAKADSDQVQVIILHADEARRRANEIYDLGKAKIEALKKEWGISEPLPTGDGSGGLQIPGQ